MTNAKDEQSKQPASSAEIAEIAQAVECVLSDLMTEPVQLADLTQIDGATCCAPRLPIHPPGYRVPLW